MKIKLELFGASREFSNKDHLEFDIKEKIEIKEKIKNLNFEEFEKEEIKQILFDN